MTLMPTFYCNYFFCLALGGPLHSGAPWTLPTLPTPLLRHWNWVQFNSAALYTPLETRLHPGVSAGVVQRHLSSVVGDLLRRLNAWIVRAERYRVQHLTSQHNYSFDTNQWRKQDFLSQDQDQDFTCCPRGTLKPRPSSQGLHRWQQS